MRDRSTIEEDGKCRVVTGDRDTWEFQASLQRAAILEALLDLRQIAADQAGYTVG
jgi:hypothetical protein